MVPAVFLIALGLTSCLAAPEKRATKIDADGCGMRPLLADNGASELKQSRIVGGDEANPLTWGSICSLLDSQYYHICGSTLVKNRKGVYYLITAAHCISQQRPRNYYGACGFHAFTGPNPHLEILNFTRLHMHPFYDENTMENDIAIFEISGTPPTNDYHQPACIAAEPYYEGEIAIVAGWGTLSSGGDMANSLRQVIKPIKSDDRCASRFRPGEYDSQSMMCAGEPHGGVDACQGDSGGPLYTYRNGLWTLTGVVSWGYGCAAPLNPGVYADVYNLAGWIDSVIN